MAKNIHTYRTKLNTLWNQMSSTVEYLIKCNGINWVADNCNEVIDVSDPEIGIAFSGTADDAAAAVDDLVLKAQRRVHGDPNYTF